MTRSILASNVAIPPAPGVLCRRLVNAGLLPASPGEGLQVWRTDTDDRWAIGLNNLIPSTNCTAVGSDGRGVAYLEHAMAALWAAGVSDATIVTDAGELPLYDGSALTWHRAIEAAGVVHTNEPWQPLVVSEPRYVQHGDRVLMALPAARAQFSYLLEYDEALIGLQSARCEDDCDFATELAWARTFATLGQLQATMGLQSLPPEVEAMCLVVYPDHLSDVPAMPDAMARHKLVDLLGDIYLAGRPVVGQIVAMKTGHSDNHELLRMLVADAERTGAH